MYEKYVKGYGDVDFMNADRYKKKQLFHYFYPLHSNTHSSNQSKVIVKLIVLPNFVLKSY